MGVPSRNRTRRGSYREPTVTGILETIRTDLWGAGVDGERSDLHKVLFIASGGTLAEWDAPAADATTQLRLRGTAQQADAVLEWMAGRDRAPRHA